MATHMTLGKVSGWLKFKRKFFKNRFLKIHKKIDYPRIFLLYIWLLFTVKILTSSNKRFFWYSVYTLELLELILLELLIFLTFDIINFCSYQHFLQIFTFCLILTLFCSIKITFLSLFYLMLLCKEVIQMNITFLSVALIICNLIFMKTNTVKSM